MDGRLAPVVSFFAHYQMMRRCFFLILATIGALAPEIAAAQAADPPEKPSLPAISVSVAAGHMQHAGHYWPTVIAGAQFPAGRWIRFEAELERSTASNLATQVRPDVFQQVDDRRVLASSVNVLFRAGTGRIAGFAGGGAGVHHIRSRFDEGLSIRNIRNGREITVVDTRASLQIVGGAEVHVAGRILGFASLRGQLLPEPNLGVTAGARVALTTMPAARVDTVGPKPAVPDGKEVRVTMRTGERRSGRFVSLTPSEFVMSQGQKRDVILLRDVRRIETVSHHARRLGLIGLAGGAAMALAVCAADDNFCGDDASFPVLAGVFGGIGGGIGAGIGAMMNAARADSNLLFENRSNPAADVTPILGNGKAGVAVRLRWKK